MAKPKMVIFDAGRTLIHYGEFNSLNGVRALMPYVISNPLELTAEEIDKRTNEVFAHFENARKQHFEVHEQTILSLVSDMLQLKFSIDLSEVEEIIWHESVDKIPMPNACKTLSELHSMGIETAVISNFDFSSRLLSNVLNDMYPENHFRFVITSSDYGIRKPNRYIFDAGIAASGHSADEIWYVGDKIAVDVDGSRSAGMVPVLYKFRGNSYGETPAGLRVMESFEELIELINSEDQPIT